MKKFASILLGLVCGSALTLGAQPLADDIVIRNDHVEMRWGGSPKNYFFRYFYFDGLNILPSSGSTAHPWEVTLLGPKGETPVLQPKFTVYKGGHAEEKDGVQTATFIWNMVLDNAQWPLTIHISLGPDDEMPRWTMEAELPEGWILTQADYPRITVKRLEGETKGILPYGYGVEYDMPTSDQLRSCYPSATGMMEMVLMHNGKSTVYFAADDREGCNKYLGMKGEKDKVTFYQSVTTSYAWSEGGHFELPWGALMGYNPQNWQETVTKWYRPFSFTCQWGEKTLAQRQIASWIKNADLWLRPIDVTPEMLSSLYRALDYYGKGVGLHWYFWQHLPYDTNYPDYFPAKEGFAEAVKKAQKMGARVTPYINGRLWDPANHTYDEWNGKDASCRQKDGSLYTEVYSSMVANTVTCPSSPIWQKIMYDTNAQILSELKTDGVYMDQIGCAASQPCYAENHSHAPGGGGWWPAAYRQMLTDIRAGLYKGKNLSLSTEENVECYMDLFDMMLVVNSPHNPATRMIPLFPLVYSDRCIYSGFTYVPWKLNDGSFNYITMKSLLWGSQLGWVSPELLMRDVNRNEQLFLKNLAEFRKGQHDIFLGGNFLDEFIPEGDNPVIDIPNYQKTNVVMGAKWKSVKGKTVYVLANMSTQDRTVTGPDGKTVTVPALNAVRINVK
jgi:hypothetical protein